MEITWHTIFYAWLAIGQVIILSTIIRKSAFSKYLPYLKHESIASLERKLFSFDDALNPKVITDEKGRIQDLNIAAEAMLNYIETEVTGKHLTLFFPPSEREKMQDMLEAEMGKEMKERRSTITIVTKHGTEIHADFVLRKKKLDTSFFYLAIFRDRSREDSIFKKYEQIIAIQRVKIDILSRGEELGGTGSWLWELAKGDMKGEMTVSDGYKRILGMGRNDRYDPAELRKKVWEDDAPIVDEALDKAFKGESYTITYRMKRSSDFKLVTIRSKVKPFVDKDGITTHLYGSATVIGTQSLQTNALVIEQ